MTATATPDVAVDPDLDTAHHDPVRLHKLCAVQAALVPGPRTLVCGGIRVGPRFINRAAPPCARCEELWPAHLATCAPCQARRDRLLRGTTE